MMFRKKLLNLEIATMASLATLSPLIATAENGALEEVIVTATRRAQSIQDIPYNISAIGGDAINRQGAFDLNDITRAIPGVAGPDLGSRSGVNSAIIMRGVNVADTGQGSVTKNLTVSTVSTYLNETPVFANFRMVDVERVEVLRGPQGTLYGSGAMGGTLRIITTAPQLDESTAEVTAGLSQNAESDEFNYEARGIFNLPLSSQLALRGALSWEDRGGVANALNLMAFENGAPRKQNPADPDSPAAVAARDTADGGEVLFGRLALLWDISDNTRATLAYLRQDEEWDHSTTRYLGDDPLLGGGDDSWEDSARLPEQVDRTLDLATLDIEHDFGFATFTSATSFSQDDSKPQRDTSDLYETFNPYYYFGYPRMNALDDTRIEQEVFSQEFRLVSNGGGDFDWVVGAYYQREDMTQDNRNQIRGFGEWADDPESFGSQVVAYYYGAYGLTSVGDFIEFGLGGIRPSTNDETAFLMEYTWEYTDLAGFGELTWHATDALQFTLGARVFHQEVDASLYQSLPYCGPACSDDGLSPEGVTRAASDSEFDDHILKFNASYDLSEESMLYLTVSEGFRRGGANALPQAGPFYDPGFSLDYEPDTLTNIELGLKGTAWDRRISYTVAAYQILWDDYQLETFNAAGFRGVVNGDKAETSGAELELTAYVTDGLTVTAGYGYVDARVTEDVVIADRSDAGMASDILHDGDALPYVPEHQASVSLDYDHPLANGLVLGFHLDGNYRSEVASQVNDSLLFDNYFEFDGYAQYNASISLSDQRWQAALWSRNLTNEEGLSSAIVRNANLTPAAEFGRRGFVSRPRAVGLRFTWYFD